MVVSVREKEQPYQTLVRISMSAQKEALQQLGLNRKALIILSVFISQGRPNFRPVSSDE